MSIGRDVYCDTRIILQKLEQLFPEGTIGASQPDQKALEKLLEIWTIDGGMFNRAAQLIPASMPLLNDPKFTKDREDYNGRSWDKSKIEANRPEALAHIRNAFNLLETTLLADDREWILKTEKPSLGDIEGKRQSSGMLRMQCFAGLTNATSQQSGLLTGSSDSRERCHRT
jgi:glutathione S-transferase